ncbi:hypothetical protein BDW71DRAFT_147609 [Aspergillus fruticulosus]
MVQLRQAQIRLGCCYRCSDPSVLRICTVLMKLLLSRPANGMERGMERGLLRTISVKVKPRCPKLRLVGLVASESHCSLRCRRVFVSLSCRNGRNSAGNGLSPLPLLVGNFKSRGARGGKSRKMPTHVTRTCRPSDRSFIQNGRKITTTSVIFMMLD